MSVTGSALDCARPEVAGTGLSAARPVLDPLRSWIRAQPQVTAIEHRGRPLTYRGLERRAAGIARHIAMGGVRPGDLVGLCAERTPDAIAAMIAVHAAGAAYVPLDPAYPRERLLQMLTDAGVSRVLAPGRLSAAVPPGPWSILPLDAAADASESGLDGSSLPGASPDGLAYVIYTSGSTGRPKGVAVEHRSLWNLVDGLGACYQLRPGDRALQFASLSFDVSVEEIFSCLAGGATLVLRAESALESYSTFVQECRRDRITVLNIPTAFWHGLTAALTPAEADLLASTVRLVVIGGEAASPERLRMWKEKCGGRIRLLNAYGPTETTVTATIWDAAEYLDSPGLSRMEAVPIGRPLENVTAHVLDDALRPVEEGAVGELCLGGAGVARGYLNRPELTAERFVPDLFSRRAGARLYRTGDLARRLPDGNLVCLGRRDGQVKIRGFRIEPGEVEAVLLRHPAVAEAAVAARSAGDARQLVAYVAARSGAELETAGLRHFAAGALPAHMVPAIFVRLPALPKAPNGKIDRRALSLSPAESGGPPAPAAPAPGRWEAIARAFEKVLGVEGVSPDDDFFSLGGDSLQALELVLELERSLGLRLPASGLMERPSVRELAGRLAPDRPAPPPAQSRSAGPATWEQKEPHVRRELSAFAMLDWSNTLFGIEPAQNSVSAVLHLKGRLDAAALKAAIDELVRRHETLRMTVPPVRGPLGWPVLRPLFRWMAGNGPIQRRMARGVLRDLEDPAKPFLPLDPRRALLRSDVEIPVAVEDAAVLRDASGKPVLPPAAEEFIRAPFDLAGGPLLRARVFRVSPQEHLLVIVISHWVADGQSVAVLTRELTALYEAFVRGEPSPLPPLPVQFSDHVSRLNREDNDRDYWRTRAAELAGAGSLPLPFWRPEPPAPDYLKQTGRESVVIPREVRDALFRDAAAQRCTPHMACLACLGALCRLYTRLETIPVSVPLACREAPGASELIANLAVGVALRVDCSGDPNFPELLGRTRREVLDALAHQRLTLATWVSGAIAASFEDGSSRPWRDEPQVFFDFWARTRPGRMAGVRFEEIRVFDPLITPEIEVLAVDRADRLEVHFRFSPDRYHREGVRLMASDYAAVLRAVAARGSLQLSGLAGSIRGPFRPRGGPGAGGA